MSRERLSLLLFSSLLHARGTKHGIPAANGYGYRLRALIWCEASWTRRYVLPLALLIRAMLCHDVYSVEHNKHTGPCCYDAGATMLEQHSA